MKSKIYFFSVVNLIVLQLNGNFIYYLLNNNSLVRYIPIMVLALERINQTIVWIKSKDNM